ncbi:hypothetical protein HQ590_13095 [bacterium]|nr:hypothetical protein [bacterium]
MEWKIHVTNLPGGSGGWPARVSVPVPRGQTARAFSVRRPDGSVVAAQHRVLIPWPDTSPRWVQLDFPANQAGVYMAQDAPAPANGLLPSLPVQAEVDGDTVRVAVGRLTLALTPGRACPLDSVTWEGRPITHGNWQFIAVDEAGQRHDLIDGAPRTFNVEADGPQRFQVSWETQHTEGLLDVRFRLEVLAGVEGFSLAYQFIHKQPGTDYLRLQALEALLPFPALEEPVVAQAMYSNLATRRFVRPNHAVTIHVDGSRFPPHVKDAAELDDGFEYPHFLRGHNAQTSGAVALQNSQVAVTVSLRDFECHRPKTLRVAPGRVSVGIWPESAGPLVMSQGRSHREVFCFTFTDPVAETIESLLVNPGLSRPQPAIGWLDKADSVHAGPTWDQPRLFDGSEPGAAFFSRLLQTATGRWATVAELKHYGDVPDPGYTVCYPGGSLAPGNRDDYVFAASGCLHAMFHSQTALAPVWTNNEYDAIYCLALEAIRTRDDGAWQKMTAAARHQVEVDFVHYSGHWQQHRSTPAHSYDHTAGTSSLASHQWTQGLYYYYALTGDDDVPEVVRAICDWDIGYLERDELKGMVHYFNRELGWAVVALVFGYEVTGVARYRDKARELLRALEKYGGRTDFQELEKHCSTSRGLNATGIGLGFVANTVPLGLKGYHQATGDPWAAELLREWVEFGMTNFNNRALGTKITELFPETFCYVADLLNDPRYLEESLWQLRVFFMGIDAVGWLDSMGGPLSTKQYTRIYRGMVFLLSGLAARGMLPRLERCLLEVP